MGKLIICMCVAMLFGCGLFKPTVSESYSETVVQDSFMLSIVPVHKVSGTIPELGDSLSMPEMNMKIIRISHNELLIKTPVRRERLTEYHNQVIAVKKIDKSRHYQDSYNKDRSRNAPRKVKEVEKTVQRTNNGLPWWVIIVIVGTIAAIWYIRSNFKLFL